jgi:tetratricopeptide (TPR) repeat protein
VHQAAPSIPRHRTLLWILLLLAVVLAAYSNHFHNSFHFDDGNAIVSNPAIRDPAMIPRFFADPNLFSSFPYQRSYRPITSVSLAIDYWLGGSLDPFFFHLSTFFWYELQLVLMFLLFRRIVDAADPHPSNFWAALAATALFGLHPANAETVNYIIQRADLYNALGCVASLWLFVRYPSQRRFGWYLLPATIAMLAKPPALIFPLLLLAYVLLFERDTEQRRRGHAVRLALPALAAASAAGVLLSRMRVSTWSGAAPSPFLYRIIQPLVALHYFKVFFLPTGLNVDPGWHYIEPFSFAAISGYLFVLGLLAAAVAASRVPTARPVAFGILWFLITLLPTSLMPLLDITNDHRMFFAFVGLVLAVTWSARLALFRITAGLTQNSGWIYGAVSAVGVLLALAAAGTWQRNQVWSTDESLWRDSTIKNPQNWRAWDAYGAIFLSRGDYPLALSLFEKANAVNPTCPICEGHLVEVYVKMNRDDVAERHFDRLVALDPPIPDPYVAYGNWLRMAGRLAQSGRPLERAARQYSGSVDLKPILFQYFVARDSRFRLAAFRALDINHDLTLSSWELGAAAASLAALDRDGDGKLSPEEYGGSQASADRLPMWEFMQSDPIWRALDANHDGEISAIELREAERELKTLDANGNGELDPIEIVPPYVADVARRILAALDLNRNGQIDRNERLEKSAEFSRDLLNAADADGDGAITLDELANEIFYRSDLNRDGIVTATEFREALRSGVFGAIPEG